MQSSQFGYARYKSDKSAGSVTNNGIINNNGQLILAGGGISSYKGVNGGSGGRFSNDGTLINTGVFTAQGGAGAVYLEDNGGSGGYADLSGTVLNSGTMSFNGGATGILTNTRDNYGIGCGYGSQLFADGVDFTNTGTLIFGAGAPAPSAIDIPGLGAYGQLLGYRGAGSFDNHRRRHRRRRRLRPLPRRFRPRLQRQPGRLDIRREIPV